MVIVNIQNTIGYLFIIFFFNTIQYRNIQLFFVFPCKIKYLQLCTVLYNIINHTKTTKLRAMTYFIFVLMIKV